MPAVGHAAAIELASHPGKGINTWIEHREPVRAPH